MSPPVGARRSDHVHKLGTRDRGRRRKRESANMLLAIAEWPPLIRKPREIGGKGREGSR